MISYNTAFTSRKRLFVGYVIILHQKTSLVLVRAFTSDYSMKGRSMLRSPLPT